TWRTSRAVGGATRRSYAQLHKVLLYLRGQFGRLPVEVGQFGVNVPQGLFEVEVLVFLRRSDTNVTAGGAAPVCGLNLLAVYELHQSWDSGKLRLRKPVLQPRHLAVEVGGVLQLFDSGLAFFVELLHQSPSDAAVIYRRNGVVCREFRA